MDSEFTSSMVSINSSDSLSELVLSSTWSVWSLCGFGFIGLNSLYVVDDKHRGKMVLFVTFCAKFSIGRALSRFVYAITISAWIFQFFRCSPVEFSRVSTSILGRGWFLLGSYSIY